MNAKYVKAEHISIKTDPGLSERWVQDIIANDPSVLGLGALDLRDKERRQPRAGRLDLLLQDQDVDPPRRYEVELQLGASNESHIIRAVEYWDIERRRYPQYDHCAVLIAEDITSRFLNIISLFNGAIPLIAIQMRALRVCGNITLVFTTVVDEVARGLVDEDEAKEAEPTDRQYWVKRVTAPTVKMVDKILEMVKEFDSSMELKYTKYYISISPEKEFFNFVKIRPRKKYVWLDVRLPRTDDWSQCIEDAGIEPVYSRGQYILRLTGSTMKDGAGAIKNILRQVHDVRSP